MKDHTGVFGWLKKLQPDLGLFKYNGHLYGTSHMASTNVGIAEENFTANPQSFPAFDPDLYYDIANDMGKYIGLLYRFLSNQYGPPTEQPYFDYSINDTLFDTEDVFATNYYKNIFNGDNSLMLNYYLLTLMLAINFLHHILTPIVIGTPETLLKLKFVCLHHFYATAQKIEQDSYKSRKLSDTTSASIKGLLQSINSSKDAKFMLASKRSKLRNIFVHYNIKEVPVTKLDQSVRFYGLVEHFCDGKSFEQVNNLLDEFLSRVSTQLEANYK